MKIGILGAGSIGCYIGGHLLNSGQEVILIGRDKLQKEISNHGLCLTGISHDEIKIPPSKIIYQTNLEYLQNVDLIIFTMKSGDTFESANKISHLAKGKIILSFQNGIFNSKKISAILKESTVLAGMVPYNVINLGNGRFHSGTSGKLLIEKKEIISNLILNAFKKSKLIINSHSNIENILWGKLIFNLNNAINALAGIPLKEELENPKFRKILSRTMKESLFILKKSGIKPASNGKMIPWLAPYILSLPNFLFFRVASSMIKIDPTARSSMWEDLENRRKVEFDFINGEILNLAKKNSLDSPIQEKIKVLIEGAEENKKGSPNLSSSSLLNLLQIK